MCQALQLQVMKPSEPDITSAPCSVGGASGLSGTVDEHFNSIALMAPEYEMRDLSSLESKDFRSL